MVANPRILKKKNIIKKKTKTQYTQLQPNLKKPEQQIHQVKQNQNRAHQRQQPMDDTSTSSNAATEHIDHHIGPQTRALEPKRQNTSCIGDQRSVFLTSMCCLKAPPFSLRLPCSLNLKVFHLFLSLVSYIYGLMGMSFSLRLSVSLSLSLSEN